MATRAGATTRIPQRCTADPAGHRDDVTDLRGFHDFGYDAVGNRDPGTRVYDAANRLLNGGTFTYTYDRNGNLRTQTELALSANVTSVPIPMPPNVTLALCI